MAPELGRENSKVLGRLASLRVSLDGSGRTPRTPRTPNLPAAQKGGLLLQTGGACTPPAAKRAAHPGLPTHTAQLFVTAALVWEQKLGVTCFHFLTECWLHTSPEEYSGSCLDTYQILNSQEASLEVPGQAVGTR